jgi:hypothetical protein
MVELHLDLSDPGAPAAVAAAEEIGFVFSGVLPGRNGLILLLQHLHEVSISYDRVHMGSPFGERLLSYIRSRDQTPSNPAGREKTTGVR